MAFLRHLVFVLMSLIAVATAQTARPTDLRTDFQELNTVAVGVATSGAQLSWQINVADGTRAQSQLAFDVQLATKVDFSPAALVWDTGRVESAEQLVEVNLVPELQGERTYYWRVQVWLPMTGSSKHFLVHFKGNFIVDLDRCMISEVKFTPTRRPWISMCSLLVRDTARQSRNFATIFLFTPPPHTHTPQCIEGNGLTDHISST